MSAVGGEVETVISGWKDLMGIALFHKQSQPGTAKPYTDLCCSTVDRVSKHQQV